MSLYLIIDRLGLMFKISLQHTNYIQLVSKPQLLYLLVSKVFYQLFVTLQTLCNVRDKRGAEFPVGHLGVHLSTMVICAIIGCGSRSPRDKDKSFYRLPSIIREQRLKALPKKESKHGQPKLTEMIYHLYSIIAFEFAQITLLVVLHPNFMM